MIGQKVTVKVAGKKYRGTVTNLKRETESLEIGPDGPGRNFIPGLTSVTLTIDLDPRPIEKAKKR